MPTTEDQTPHNVRQISFEIVLESGARLRAEFIRPDKTLELLRDEGSLGDFLRDLAAKCSRCGGTGRVTQAGHPDYEIPCSACGGMGAGPPKPSERRKTEPENPTPNNERELLRQLVEACEEEAPSAEWPETKRARAALDERMPHPTAIHEHCVACRAAEGVTAEQQSLVLLGMLASGQSSVARIILDLCEPHRRWVRSSIEGVTAAMETD